MVKNHLIQRSNNLIVFDNYLNRIEQLIKELDPSNTTFFDIEHFIRVIIHSMQ